MLDSKDISYRQLQQLAMQLGLGGRGKRDQLVIKLRKWHQERQNFAMVEIDMEGGSPSRPDRTASISPRFLSPFRKTKKSVRGSPLGILSPSKQINRETKDRPKPRRNNIKFSIVNGVQIIPSRSDLESAGCLHRFTNWDRELDEDEENDY